MNLDELRSAQAKERRKDSLQHLRDSFYDDVAAYVSDLRAARDRRAEQVAKPFSDDDIRRMSDEIETAEEVAEALYERRVGKVVKLASFAAADISVDADGMTTEERQLFEDLVERIGDNKSRVLDVLSGETAPAVNETETAASAEDPTAVEGTPAGETGDPAPPAPEPEPPTATDPAAPTDEPEPQPPDPDGGALAGAMGNADDEVADALDATPADASPTDTPPAAETGEEIGGNEAATDDDGVTTNDDGVTTDGGPTAVPPESAPPGASDPAEPTVSAGTDPAAGPDPSAAETPANVEAGRSTEPNASTAQEPDASTATGIEGSTDDRATVRITRDVGSIFGVDEREYHLADEDVVTLPVENADPLVQRDAAERID